MKKLQNTKNFKFIGLLLIATLGFCNAQKMASLKLDDSNDSIYHWSKNTSECYKIFPKGDHKYQILILVPERPIGKRALSNSLVIVGASFASMGILYIMPESITNWDEDARSLDNIIAKWKRNVRKGPILDQDNFMLNWIMHPYFGALYYQSLRGAGYSWYYSFLYSAIYSTFFWEYGIEALAEVPSLQDIIITPTVGSAFGEGFHWARKKLKSNNDRLLGSLFLGRTGLFLLDPLNEVHDIFLRKKIHKKISQSMEIQSYALPFQKGFQFGVNIQF